MKPDKDLTQKPSYMPHSDMFMFSLRVRPVLILSERQKERNEISLTVGKYQTLNLYMKLKQSESCAMYTKEQIVNHKWITFSEHLLFLWSRSNSLTAISLAVSWYGLSVNCCYNCWTSTSVIPHESRVWKHTDHHCCTKTNSSSSLCLQLFHLCI